MVKRILKHAGRDITELMGDGAYLSSLNPEQFIDEQFGEPTVRDILLELEKPGRDPRPEFKAVKFSDGIESIKDLQNDQVLEGQVTNVTAFGAFVDIGVHQDGLVHISALADTYVKDPRSVVKAGDIVKVKVMSVDVERNRIALSMRMTDESNASSNAASAPTNRRKGNAPGQTRDSKKATSGGNNRRGSGKHQRQAAQPDESSALALSLKAALAGKSDA